MNFIQKTNLIILSLFFSYRPVFGGYDLRSVSGEYDSIFGRLIDMGQSVIDFIQGPFLVGFVILGIFLAGCFWILAPDNRHLNKFFKAIAVGFILADVAVIMDKILESA